jgi:CsoR family transcriptional regulator, copper-sensing transcriptional repressor
VIDDKIAKNAGVRLNRLAGQLRGIQKMIDERRYCVDMLTQISAVQAALSGVGKVLLKNHIETCVTTSLSGKDKNLRKQTIEELVQIFGRFCKVK